MVVDLIIVVFFCFYDKKSLNLITVELCVRTSICYNDLLNHYPLIDVVHIFETHLHNLFLFSVKTPISSHR